MLNTRMATTLHPAPHSIKYDTNLSLHAQDSTCPFSIVNCVMFFCYFDVLDSSFGAAQCKANGQVRLCTIHGRSPLRTGEVRYYHYSTTMQTISFCVLLKITYMYCRLSTSLMQITELSPEPWVAMGYYCLATNRASRSVFFAQKVIYSLFSRFLIL